MDGSISFWIAAVGRVAVRRHGQGRAADDRAAGGATPELLHGADNGGRAYPAGLYRQRRLRCLALPPRILGPQPQDPGARRIRGHRAGLSDRLDGARERREAGGRARRPLLPDRQAVAPPAPQDDAAPRRRAAWSVLGHDRGLYKLPHPRRGAAVPDLYIAATDAQDDLRWHLDDLLCDDQLDEGWPPISRPAS